MKRITSLLLSLFAVLTLSAQMPALQQHPQSAEWEKLSRPLNFYMVNDMGRNGYYDQKPIAELLGQMTESLEPECVFAVGDIHHFYGVASTQDPLWTNNYERIYSHPGLMLPWYPVLGNHEYRGNTQAVLDYATVSRRWMMPARYYTKTFESDGATIRFILLDTTPLIDRYRKHPEKYPDAGKQDMEAELKWLDETLANAKEDWVIVMGHHPIFAATDKTDVERRDMQSRVLPILKRHHVDIYACGHIHNFQHIRLDGLDTDFVVNSAAALSRAVAPYDAATNSADGKTSHLLFGSGATGFSVITADAHELCLHFLDRDGRVIHTVKRTK